MDVTRSVGLPSGEGCEPSTNEKRKGTEIFSSAKSHLDQDSPAGDRDQNDEKFMCISASDAAACQAESSIELSTAGNVVVSGSNPEAPLQFNKVTKSSALDATNGSLDQYAVENVSHLDANVTGEALDLEKGLGALPLQGQVPSHESSHVKVVIPGKLDRNGSSGERICRVCHLGHAAQPESGPSIELGCECKHDLAFAHRHCAEAWFKIKGNRTCEICGSTVQNVSGNGDVTFMENWTDGDARAALASDGAQCWQNHRLFNILLACMVFAFVLPWLFHVSSFFS